MEAKSLLATTRALVEAPSPSGEEGPALRVAEDLLREAGLRVDRQEVGAPGRYNVFAALGTPRVVLTTHLDTVRPALPTRLDGNVLHGRGACDAKGAAAAMIHAAQALVARKRTDFGVLFLVGEEEASDGAIAANELLISGSLGWNCHGALFGEPTDNRWVASHPGVVIARLATVGQGGHSSEANRGKSAVHALIHWLHELDRLPWTSLESTFHVGRIDGGVAANVVADKAHADIMVRGRSAAADVIARLWTVAPEGASIVPSCVANPVRFRSFVPADGEAPEPTFDASFASDAPFLAIFRRSFMLGPGLVAHAHSAEERITGEALVLAARLYVTWAERELALDLDGSRS